MARGFFIQGAAVLLAEPLSLADLTRALRNLKPLAPREEPTSDPWISAPRSVLVPFRPEANGYLLVEALDAAWPDGMGDPQTDPTLFGAWSLGAFGPFVFPQSLQRAQRMAAAFTWKEAPAAVARHRAFIRIKSSYVLGNVGSKAPICPEDYESLPECMFMLQLVAALMELPSALAYFNPNGEVLAGREELQHSLSFHARQLLPPLDMLANIRLFEAPGAEGWRLMDTLGMEQLDVDDMEACYPFREISGGEVHSFLRNATDYVRESGPIIQHRDTMDGPGERVWRAYHAVESLAPRPRATIRWFPADLEMPEALLAGVKPLA